MTGHAAANGRPSLEEPLPGMVGRHPKMLEVYRLTRLAATAELPVLIVGETGTGKELVARALHVLKGGPERPLVVVNCAAVPENLAEGEFFGWERGAFSGAVARRRGKLELANCGTLVLDEACSLSLNLQAKLLRAMEYGEFERVGGTDTIRSRFRLVTAASEPVARLLAQRRWRADFAARVEGLTIGVPPLRERGGDIEALAQGFLAAACTELGSRKELDPAALRMLRQYSWPRNVRELRTVMTRLAVLAPEGTITARVVLAQVPDLTAEPDQRALLETALKASRWNLSAAARALGLGRTWVYVLVKRYGLERPQRVTPSVHTEQPVCSD